MFSSVIATPFIGEIASALPKEALTNWSGNITYSTDTYMKLQTSTRSDRA
jgi:hypothetical protein